ncbi:MAG: SusC/RagA family TonB-linked outer membrane protein [Bacteroidota bacterium]
MNVKIKIRFAYYMKIAFMLVIFLVAFNAKAQSFVVRGVIKDTSDQTTMVGVIVRISGTNIGTTSDINGNYEIKAPTSADTLVFSFIGYQPKKIQINNRSVINISMQAQALYLEGVVVTALGIEREKKSLGYSVTEVKGDQLQTAKDVNVVNQLSGKVAGLDISATNGGAGSSSKIVMRGNKSFTSSNQALIVVDGVPIDNTTVSNAGDKWGGRDYGSGISDINPDDIESISVLKGASASALYGSRAANGVILITTKKGKSGKNLSVNFSSNSAIDIPYSLWEMQNIYGAGRNGKFESPWNTSNGQIKFDPTSAASYGSWGPKMEGQTITDWDGKTRSFSAQPDNYIDYYRNGAMFNNSASVSGGSTKRNFRFTLSNVNSSDIVPSVNMNRTNLSLNSGIQIVKKIRFQSFVSYINQKYNNRLGLSDAHNNVARNYVMMPRNISNQSLSDYVMNDKGEEQTWYMNWGWMSNPYWNEQFEINKDGKNRVFGNASLFWEIDTNLTLLVRTAPDISTHNFINQDAYNGLISSLGAYSTSEIRRQQYNTDMLLSWLKEFKKLTISFNVGANAMYDHTENDVAYTVGGLKTANIYSIENSLNIPEKRSYLYEKAINSVYLASQFSFKNFLFLDITARNDWSSTLPKGNNSYFYPSFSTGFVFSDLLKLSKRAENIFSFGKIRASWAAVGNDTDPYRLSKTYVIDTIDTYGPIAYVNGTIPPTNLKPENLISKEIGTDLRFFMNRIGIDFSYYITNSFNQIVRIDVSPTSGARYALINAGNIQNKGIELQINGTPIKKKNFNWSFTWNYTKNKSEVIELAPGVENLQLMEHWGLSIEARPGHPYGDIVGYAIKRDGDGNKMIDENGMYLRTDTSQVLGNVNPKFKTSLSNSFGWKAFSLSFLIDMRIGGEMFAGTNMYGYGYSGNFKETLEGREGWHSSEEARIQSGLTPEQWEATGGYLAEGVYSNGVVQLNGQANPQNISDLSGYTIQNGNVIDNGGNVVGKDLSGTSNSQYVNPEKYWSQFSDWTNEIHEPFIYDASYVKLREVTLSWKIPTKFAKKLRTKNASISIYGRNLWLIYSKVPNVDPETFHNSGSGQGYELYSYPNRRTIGINLKFEF